MVGCLIRVGINKLSLEHVQELLCNDSREGESAKCEVVNHTPAISVEISLVKRSALGLWGVPSQTCGARLQLWGSLSHF